MSTTIAELGRWAADLQWSEVPPPQQHALTLVLENCFQAMHLGAGDEEHHRLRAVVSTTDEQAPVVQADASLTVSTARAAWLNSLSLVRFELDEGHTAAAGHPAAHCFPAILALAAERGSSRDDLLAALTVGHEVAARFGRSTRLGTTSHPHGSWGVPGAAAGTARLLGLDATAIAAAMDTAGGMAIAGPFTAATQGNPVRDLWIAASNQSGLWATEMAAAGVARNTGIGPLSIAFPDGAVDMARLTERLGDEWLLGHGYIKRHSSCAFTHPAADAAEQLTGIVPAGEIKRVVVETSALCAQLDAATADSRLQAMFSIPAVVASMLTDGQMSPVQIHRACDPSSTIARLALRVDVVASAEFDRALPLRGARVTVHTISGEAHVAEIACPIGDARNRPFDRESLRDHWLRLLPADLVAAIARATDRLVADDDTPAALQQLATPTGER